LRNSLRLVIPRLSISAFPARANARSIRIKLAPLIFLADPVRPWMVAAAAPPLVRGRMNMHGVDMSMLMPQYTGEAMIKWGIGHAPKTSGRPNQTSIVDVLLDGYESHEYPTASLTPMDPFLHWSAPAPTR
jgi:hypothetical protein